MYNCIMVKNARNFDLLYKLELLLGTAHSSAAIANFKSKKSSRTYEQKAQWESLRRKLFY